MYFDTAYIAKFYLNEPDSVRVRELVQKSDGVYSSIWAVAEFHSLLHRQVREGFLAPRAARDLAACFSDHTAGGLWTLLPLTEALLRRAGALILAAPKRLFLRTGDAIHLISAQEAGESAVYTNDRHMLASAAYFGLTGRSA